MLSADTITHIILGALAGIFAAGAVVLLVKNRSERHRYQQLCFDQDVLDEALKDSENRFKFFYDTAFEGIAITAAGVFIDCNSNFAAIFGKTRDDLIGKSVLDLVHPDDRALVLENITAQHNKPYQHRCRHAGGSIIYVEVCGQKAYYQGKEVRVTAINDITARKQAEDELAKAQARERQASKMEAIGTFAAGIAHDLNNALSPIIGHAGVMLLECSEVDKKSIESILKAADLAAKLVHRIQSFTKTNGSQLQPLDLNYSISECFAFLRSAIPSTVELSLILEPNLLTVMATETTIKQILMNLCKNAAQALPADIGNIVISAKNFTPTEPFFEIPAGSYVQLEVEDNGCGMDTKTVEQALDPYFTTKNPAINSGIGLSVVRGIIESYKSYIHLYSEPGVGTRVSIYIPATSARQKPADVADPPVDVPMGHGEHILFCDDEQYMCEVIGQVLESLNYQVTSYHDSRAALDDFASQPQKYSVVISDATMPKLTGLKLLQHVKAANPQVKTILCSGLGSNCKAETALAADDIDGFITKPASREVFAQTLNEILNS